MRIYEEPIIEVPRFNEENGFYTTTERSQIMSKIKSKNTKAEIILRKALWHKGIRYRIHNKKLPGSPDIVIGKYKIALFIDGEFWHGYNWEQKKQKINKNRAFWIPKIERNMQRDKMNNIALLCSGYLVIRFWEKQIKSNLQACIAKIDEKIEELSV